MDQNKEKKDAENGTKKLPTMIGRGTLSGRGPVRHRHPNRDFFVTDLFDDALKEYGASMEAPIFTLSNKPDTSVWEWRGKDGNKSVDRGAFDQRPAFLQSYKSSCLGNSTIGLALKL